MRWLAAWYLCCYCCCLSQAVSATPQQRCGPATPAADDAAVCFDASAVAFKVVAKEWQAAVLRCVVRNLGREVVTWMKNDGRDIPLTVGPMLFAADKARMRLNGSQATGVWDLVIEPVWVSDAGQYLCQVSVRGGIMVQDYALIVEESDFQPTASPASGRYGYSSPSTDNTRLLSDDRDLKGRGSSSRVWISGETAVFAGTRHFPLTCTVRFGSRDAKAILSPAGTGDGSSPSLGIEWYHQGVRQATETGSVDISQSWADSDTAVSVLTINWVRPAHSGEWVCLKRPPEFGVAMETATHTLRVLVRDAASDVRPGSEATGPEAAAAAAAAAAGSDYSLAAAGIGAAGRSLAPATCIPASSGPILMLALLSLAAQCCLH